MNLNIFQNLELSFKMAIMSYLEEITKQINPEFICWIRFEDYRCYIVFQRFNDLDQMPWCWSLLHYRQVECSNDSIRMSAVTLNIYILLSQSWSLKMRINSLGSSDVTHWYLIFFILRHILRKGMTHNDKLLSISNVWVFFKNVSNSIAILIITRILVFREPSLTWIWFHKNLENISSINDNAIA